MHTESQLAGSPPPGKVNLLGHVVSVRGSQAGVEFPSPTPQHPEEARATVGKFLGIISGKSLLIGVVTDVYSRGGAQDRSRPMALAQMDLVGEIRGTPTARFQRGVTSYAAIGDPVIFIGPRELRMIFQDSTVGAIEVGHLQQDSAIAAYVNIEDLLSKHFAVLGTTGVGKSSAITLLLRQILATYPGLRAFVLDVHNEYGRCFGPLAQILNPQNVKLPFWLFNFDEIVDVFFGGRPGLEDEIDILSEVIPLAKSVYAQQSAASGRAGIRNPEASGLRYTVDVPVPYRLSDVIALLDARMGKLENRSSRMIYHRLITRIETVASDLRYAFMFEQANVGGDTMTEVLGQLFRLPPNGVPVTVMQLAGFPSEVIDAVVSVTCRMAFDLGLWSDGAYPLLLVCEEAHRYMAADHSGFAPTRRALSRIAKEGRKYGVFLGLVTQRPAELDPTILSQCSTLFAMRMTNDRDQELLRAAVADTATNLLAFVPSLGTGEAIAFGEGLALPIRLKFMQLPEEFLPRSEIVSREDGGDKAGMDEGSLAAIVERWRGRAIKQRVASVKPQPQVPEPSACAPPAPRPETERTRLLRQSLQEKALAGGERVRQMPEPPRR
jgi:DNA helicase HerA-like ATPase